MMIPARIRVLITLMVASWMFPGGDAVAQDRLALWKIANEQCVPKKASTANQVPAPCLAVQLGAAPHAGFVILKDRVGAAQVLAIPTVQISGIESVSVLQPSIGALWPAAWHARHFIAGLLDVEVPDDFIGMAINSSQSRSQDQLHIHVDCLKPDVRQLLHDHVAEIGGTWTTLGFEIDGKHYRALRLKDDELEKQNLFALVSGASPDSADDMGAETIFVTAADFLDGSKGFIVLEDKAGRTPGDLAHAEDLLDHTCKLNGQP
jgi:CDP-diacylglycerol pyrophosphatase